MLYEKLNKLDNIIAGGIKNVTSKVLHSLLDEMKALIKWNKNDDGTEYAVDISTGEIIVEHDAQGKVLYQVDDLPPMSVLFANT